MNVILMVVFHVLSSSGKLIPVSYIHNFISGYLETIDILIVFNEIWEKGVKTTNVFGGWYVLYDSSI